MADSHYPHLREVLDARFAELEDHEFDAVFASAFGEDVTAAEYEEFFSGLGRALNAAAPVLASAGQGALSGAAAGASVGGLWGGLGGAVAGGLGSALAQHGRGPARDIGRAISGVVGTAGALTGRSAPISGGAPPAPQMGAPAVAAVPAAGHLSALLADPRVAAALAMLLQGRNGTVPVGAAGTPVQAAEVAGLVGALALEAATDAGTWESGEGVPDYLTDATGQAVVDPADPVQRAGRLLQLFATESQAASPWDEAEFDEAGEFDVGDLYDGIDALPDRWTEARWDDGAEVDDLYEGLEVGT